MTPTFAQGYGVAGGLGSERALVAAIAAPQWRIANAGLVEANELTPPLSARDALSSIKKTPNVQRPTFNGEWGTSAVAWLPAGR
jgi:hypothetical protein